MDEYLRKAAIAIAKTVDSYIYTTISAGVPAANVATQATRNSVNILKELSKGMTVLRKADVPADRPKWIVTQPDDFAAFEDGLTNQAAESNLSNVSTCNSRTNASSRLYGNV